ncbi:tellurium resistance protein TerC [Alteromonas aestuariivivens]|uniref:Tellurium resistance protein TerC n=1 Tax=Alteromonas aestuariivivens TaxID=1938339 RepID=A0A3D8M921_9ALTE|nr:PGPGW domain-containing protein [Alteromonas aestuariivivens]RDV26178.1 tellurium resistance protein TerC [Alteromonas aestuariivivens]
MKKILRLSAGSLLLIAGIVLTLLPGSILLVLAGLVLLSYDWPKARGWLKKVQKTMSRGAQQADRWLLARKLRG